MRATDDEATTRRQVVAGLGVAGVSFGGLGITSAAIARSTAPLRDAKRARDPDLGPDVVIVDPSMRPAVIQARIDAIFARQERAEFGDGRHAILFKPGRYAVDANIGFYTQIAGLGILPRDVTIDGHVHVEADWAKGMALVNFWRGAENMRVVPPDGADRWAVSQAAPYRRMHLVGDLALDDGGWSSGGFLADSRIDGTVRSGSQQQWFTRNSALGGWQGANWNMMFMGTAGAPATSFPSPPYTTVSSVPRIREKPFLVCSTSGEWSVFRPALRGDAHGTSWSDGSPAGEHIALARFLIATPATSARRINAALASGKHLLLTPGIYRLAEPIRVVRAGTVVLGIGLATLMPVAGTAALLVADEPGICIAGVLIDAGPIRSPLMMQVGSRVTARDHGGDPITLSDVFFRVGGATPGRAGTCLEINSRGVIGDHLWIWRADHGDVAGGRVHVGWTTNTADHGLVVNGDDVVMYGLFVEHFQQYQTLWNGERGRIFFYQCELPYDPPSRAAWTPGDERGWAAYKVADHVDDHHAIGMGVYANFTADPDGVLDSAIEVPRKPGVVIGDVTTISLGGGKGTIEHPVNDTGAAARAGAIRQTLVRYPVQGATPS